MGEMRMIFDDLQKANIETLKSHDKVAHEVISLVFGRAKNTAIDKGYPDRKLPDSECLQLIQKFIKELEEEKINFEKAGRAETVEKLASQQKLLEKNHITIKRLQHNITIMKVTQKPTTS